MMALDAAHSQRMSHTPLSHHFHGQSVAATPRSTAGSARQRRKDREEERARQEKIHTWMERVVPPCTRHPAASQLQGNAGSDSLFANSRQGSALMGLATDTAATAPSDKALPPRPRGEGRAKVERADSSDRAVAAQARREVDAAGSSEPGAGMDSGWLEQVVFVRVTSATSGARIQPRTQIQALAR